MADCQPYWKSAIFVRNTPEIKILQLFGLEAVNIVDLSNVKKLNKKFSDGGIVTQQAAGDPRNNDIN